MREERSARGPSVQPGGQHRRGDRDGELGAIGLAACGFTNSARNVDRLAEGIEVGNLWINHFVEPIAETPIGDVKGCGFGCEGRTEGPQCYTVVKNVSQLTA